MKALEDMIKKKNYFIRVSPLQSMFKAYSFLSHDLSFNLSNDVKSDLSNFKIRHEKIRQTFNAFKHKYDHSTIQSLQKELEAIQFAIEASDDLIEEDSYIAPSEDTYRELDVLEELIEMKEKGESLEEIEYYYAMEHAVLEHM